MFSFKVKDAVTAHNSAQATPSVASSLHGGQSTGRQLLRVTSGLAWARGVVRYTASKESLRVASANTGRHPGGQEKSQKQNKSKEGTK